MANKKVYLRSNGGETIAYEDQITSGVWHIPPKATEIIPPSFTETQTCKFIDDKWVVEDIPVPEVEPEPEPYIETYADKRRAEYPTIAELTVALYDTDDKSAVEAKRAEVKAKYPKP